MVKFKYIKCKPIKLRLLFISWIIILIQGNNPFKRFSTSHRALSYFDGFQWWVIDISQSRVIQKRPLYKFIKDYKIILEIHLKLNISNQIMDNWFSNIKNKKYDKSIALVLLNRLLNFVTFKYCGTNYKKLICSEIFIHFCENILNLRMGDPDHYDLLETDRVAEWVRDYYGHTESVN